MSKQKKHQDSFGPPVVVITMDQVEILTAQIAQSIVSNMNRNFRRLFESQRNVEQLLDSVEESMENMEKRLQNIKETLAS